MFCVFLFKGVIIYYQIPIFTVLLSDVSPSRNSEVYLVAVVTKRPSILGIIF